MVQVFGISGRCDSCGENIQHLENLGVVLRRLRQANLRLKPVKCALCRDEVLYLGHIVSRHLLQHGVLYRRFESPSRNQLYLQLVVPKDQQNKILQEIHGGRMGGHLGEESTFKKLQEWFYWPGYSQSVKEWCYNCPH